MPDDSTMAEKRPSLGFGYGPVPGSGPVSLLFAWGAFVALAAFYVLYVTPRRGALYSDEAWYLYNAVQALSHGEIGSYLPQAPSHLFNAFFMLVVGDGYLAQRHVYTACTLAAGATLLAGAGGPGLIRCALFPLGLSCILVAGLSSVINYQNGPGLFLAMGLGLYFFAERAAQARLRGLPAKALGLSLAAGFCLAASAMANLTVAPGLALICLVLLWRAIRERRLLFAVCPLSCGAFLAAMATAYALSIGLDRLLHVPEGHGFLFGRLGELALAALAWPAAWTAFGLIGRLATRRADPFSWGAWLFLAAFLTLFAKSFLVAGDGWTEFPLDLVPTFNPVILLPHFAYGLASLALVRSAMSGGGHGGTWTRAASALAAILLYWAQQTFYSEIFVVFSMIFASGFLVALGMILWAMAAPSSRPRGQGIALAAALIFVAGNLGYLEIGGWTGETRLSGPKVALDEPRLRGILESPERAAMLVSLRQAYEAAGCRDKTLLCFNNASLLHYVLDHPAPEGLSYIPQPIYFEDRIRRIVEGTAPWCILYSSSYRRPGTADAEEAFMARLASHAAFRRDLGIPGTAQPYCDFVLFTGPGTGVGP